MKVKKLFMVVIPVLLGLVAMVALLQVMSVSSVFADSSPTVDGLLKADDGYTYVGEFAQPDEEGTMVYFDLYSYSNTLNCYWAIVVDQGYNDNVVGPDTSITDQAGWQGGHTLKDLKQSDMSVSAIDSCTYSLDYVDYDTDTGEW
jgi:hypothetical protein